MVFRTGAVLLAGLLMVGSAGEAAAQSARTLYTRALAQERAVRDGGRPQTAQSIRSAIAAYERVVQRYPRSGYADNALWQAGHLSLLAYERFGNASDKRTGLRLLNLLKSEYPASSLLGRLPGAMAQFETARARVAAPVRAAARPAREEASAPAAEIEPPALDDSVATSTPSALVRGITRTRLDNGVRVSIEVDRELLFHQERLNSPQRVFFDLKGARPAPELLDATLKYTDDVVQEIRLGRHPQHVTRVVMDTEGVESYSVFTLYNPFRVIVDFKRSANAAAGAVPPSPVAVPTTGPEPAKPPAAAATAPAPPSPLPSRPAASPALSAPSVPAVNSNGTFSLARQLGLGIAKVVIDAGHGGHDPGTRAHGLSESELTLDVALRLQQLLAKQPGVEVVMTRDKDVYIPLEERTAIANREAADLFLSIHVNASRNRDAAGVETYVLNFATNPEAEAVAARENSASGRTMHNLPSIVQAIALNNKIDESRDLAAVIQKAMIGKLRAKNRHLRDRGVKQAPFVVLIGAGMPSVLAEMAFITNKQEGQLLKTPAYRETIAEALFDAIVRYQRSLKVKSAIASREN
ncbi:MAG TPA: N-acetylmuramoyl-L-alanine amidase [Vicinamibacterales bacterium]|nr:N-acetylmuramoyl-L-alanine amidase [Vicinamibacterales bacterium]